MTDNKATLDDYKREARACGVEAGTDAASWVLDGNTSTEHIARMVKWLDDGDPRVDEYLPAIPDLSGEWADGLTPIRLYEQITGLVHSEQEESAGLAYETLVGSVVDALADAWEEGASETFSAECERLLRAALPEDA